MVRIAGKSSSAVRGPRGCHVRQRPSRTFFKLIFDPLRLSDEVLSPILAVVGTTREDGDAFPL